MSLPERNDLKAALRLAEERMDEERWSLDLGQTLGMLQDDVEGFYVALKELIEKRRRAGKWVPAE